MTRVRLSLIALVLATVSCSSPTAPTAPPVPTTAAGIPAVIEVVVDIEVWCESGEQTPSTAPYAVWESRCTLDDGTTLRPIKVIMVD